MLMNIIIRLKTLNLFASSTTVNNEYELENERISTRIFIILLILSVLIVTIYAAQVNVIKTTEIKEPSYEEFHALTFHYPETLHCPCENPAISHEAFIILIPQFHQLCTSVFISKDWIDYLTAAAGIYVSDDFSYTGVMYFRMLASFCRMANNTITNAMQTFKTTRFITANVLFKTLFEEQINAIIQSFEATTELTYYQTFHLLQFSIQANVLLSGLFSNMIASLQLLEQSMAFKPRTFQNNTCECGTSISCTDPLTLEDRRQNQSDLLSIFTIPGLYKGCYLVDAIIQSTLECFYQPSCISAIKTFLQASHPFTTSNDSLNVSISSRFTMFSTIDQLLTKAMTEEWVKHASHVQYFTECQVLSCTYSKTSKFNVIYIITILIGLAGGLTKILRIITPLVVKFIRHRLVPRPVVENGFRK